jgi:phospholipase C
VTDIGRRRLLQAGVAAGLSRCCPASPGPQRSPAAQTAASKTCSTSWCSCRRTVRSTTTSARCRACVVSAIASWPRRRALQAGGRTRSLWLQPDASGTRAIAPFPLDTARTSATCGWKARRTLAGRSAPGTTGAWGTGRRPSRTTRWATSSAATCPSSSRWPMPSPSATPTTARCRPDQPEPGVPVDRPQRCCRPRRWPVIANSHDNFPEHGGHPASYRWTSYVERLQKAGVSGRSTRTWPTTSPTTRWPASRRSARPPRCAGA